VSITPPNNSMPRAALSAAADAERWAVENLEGDYMFFA
jgi:hypothetical protein